MESRQQPSWIWQTSSLEEGAGISDPELKDIMHVKWCKVIAQVEWFEEEVGLTIEGIRRTLLFFECTVHDWECQGEAHVGEPTMDEETTAGVRAYAARQATLYCQLVDVFVND